MVEIGIVVRYLKSLVNTNSCIIFVLIFNVPLNSLDFIIWKMGVIIPVSWCFPGHLMRLYCLNNMLSVLWGSLSLGMVGYDYTHHWNVPRCQSPPSHSRGASCSSSRSRRPSMLLREGPPNPCSFVDSSTGSSLNTTIFHCNDSVNLKIFH